MKVKYEFNVFKPDEREALARFQQADKMYTAILEFSHNIKRRTASLSEEEITGYNLAMKYFFDIIEENQIRIDI